MRAGLTYSSVGAIALLIAVGVAPAAAQSDCPECDQYELVLPDPRGDGGSDGSGGASASPGGAGGSSSSAPTPGSPPETGASEAARDGSNGPSTATKRSRSADDPDRRTRARRSKSKKGENAAAALPRAVPAESLEGRELDFERQGAGAALLDQLANPLGLLLVAAIAGSMLLASRRRATDTS